MRTVSPAALRAMLAQETGEVFLICLTINHPTFTTPYLLVNDQRPLTRTAGIFESFAFDVALPAEQDDQVPQVTLTIDNLDRKVLQSIRTIGAPRPSVALEVVLASTPNTVEAGPFNFAILSVTYDAMTIQGVLGFEDDLLNTAFPGDTYTPTNSQGLFL